MLVLFSETWLELGPNSAGLVQRTRDAKWETTGSDFTRDMDKSRRLGVKSPVRAISMKVLGA